MCSHLVLKRAIYYRFFSPPQCHYQYLLRFRLSTQTQPKELPFIADYLISSFGFSLNRALKASVDSQLTVIKSPAQPEAMVKFLTDTGLSHSQIKSVISLQPAVLGYDADETLRPKVRELMEKGIPGEVLVQLFRYNPVVLRLQDTLARLLFWRDFVGNDDKTLLKVISKNPFLISLHIENHILPRLNVLKEYGLSNRPIVSCLAKKYGLTNTNMVWVLGHCNLDHLRQTLDLVEELRAPRGSKRFVSGLIEIGNLNIGKIKSNVEFFKNTYGWSQKAVCIAFRKFPLVLRLSEENVKSSMNFLTSKVGIEARSIASRPQILGRSVEKVLIPRYTILSTLQSKGLMQKCRFFRACLYSEKRFREKYVVHYEKQVPGLGEAYVAAFGGKVPVFEHFEKKH